MDQTPADIADLVANYIKLIAIAETQALRDHYSYALRDELLRLIDAKMVGAKIVP